MRFENHTPSPAVFQCAEAGTEERLAVVIWKLTYELSNRAAPEEWTYSADPMPITGDLLETPFGTFHGDMFLGKRGVDLCVLGHLRREKPIAQTRVTLRCGAFSHALCVTGDRVWTRSGRNKTLVPSAPQRFTEMDLSYARAFGGAAQSMGTAAPFADNPVGRGYYLESDEAEGRPLPNIEADRDARTQRWDDRPTPVGWGPYPMHWGLRARSSVHVDPKLNVVTGVSPSIYNNAHPELIVPAVAPGDRIELTGVYEEPFAFSLPPTMGAMHVRVGDVAFEILTAIDGVSIWLDARRLVITQRANFRYRVRPREVRATTLTLHRA